MSNRNYYRKLKAFESKDRELKSSPFLSIALCNKIQIEVRLLIFVISNEEKCESNEKWIKKVNQKKKK